MQYKTLNKIYNISRKSPFLFKNSLSLLKTMNVRHLNVRMDTTNFCNLKCKMCYFSHERVANTELMDIETFKQVAEKLFKMTRMLYLSCAAEPLVNRNFDKFITLSSHYDIPFVSFATNGMLMNKKIIMSCIENRISEIVFSIDGNTPATMENIRRGSNFKKVVDNLTMTNNLILEAKSTYPVIRINFALMKSNFHELEDFINHFSSFRKVHLIDIRHMRVHEGMDMEDEMLSETFQSDYSELLSRMANTCSKRGVILQYPRLCYIPARNPDLNSFCPIPFFSLYIDHQGDIRYCPYMKESYPVSSFLIPSIRQIEKQICNDEPNCGICECAS